MRDLGAYNELADFRQHRSDRFGASGHHAYDGSGGDADAEHAAQKVMDTLDAYCPEGAENASKYGKGITVLYVSPDVVWEEAFHFLLLLVSMRA